MILSDHNCNNNCIVFHFCNLAHKLILFDLSCLSYVIIPTARTRKPRQVRHGKGNIEVEFPFRQHTQELVYLVCVSVSLPAQTNHNYLPPVEYPLSPQSQRWFFSSHLQAAGCLEGSIYEPQTQFPWKEAHHTHSNGLHALASGRRAEGLRQSYHFQ